MTKEQFINNGFDIVETSRIPEISNTEALQDYIQKNNLDKPENLGDLVKFLKILIEDEKVNGYGLNFVGRNFARAKYAQKTSKELRLNTSLSKDIDTTQNLVLKGDNLDCLKILKNHYSGKIKCIYIDPPYNTDSDEFVYPDKFDKEELEVLGLANLSEEDFARMDFSFKTKKSHNGWLAFMYPRLLLARDLLSNDGAIFISIDDNEQANLKLLCDDVFGEENFRNTVAVKRGTKSVQAQFDSIDKLGIAYEYLLVYTKNSAYKLPHFYFDLEEGKEGSWNNHWRGTDRPSMRYEIFGITPEKGQWRWALDRSLKAIENYNKMVSEIGQNPSQLDIDNWYSKQENEIDLLRLSSSGKPEHYIPPTHQKYGNNLWTDLQINGTSELERLDLSLFDNPKNVELIKRISKWLTNNNEIILDFFAGSGTTGHAVMQLNAEDGGNRKFILCQIDEPIKEDKPAYKFCIENNLPPVISSITIERLKRAGEKLSEARLAGLKDKQDLSSQQNHANLENPENRGLDVGFKVFDTVEAPKLEVDDAGQISFPEIKTDAISRIYNMIFTVGLDEPTQVPEEVVKDCIYKVGNHYYLTNSEQISKEAFADCIKNGKVFIDGWTASLNGTLASYKEDVKIVF
jgi:adenine-specific DNA-methyltransferase